MSVSIQDSVRYGLVIQTNMYAGNFERELTAYCTGQIGECGVGQAEAGLFEEDVPGVNFDLDQLPDDNGCHRPCSIYDDAVLKQTDYPQNNSVIIFFYKKPTQEQIDLIMARAELFSTPGWKTKTKLEIKGHYVIEMRSTVKKL